jgi:hypothetical protein
MKTDNIEYLYNLTGQKYKEIWYLKNDERLTSGSIIAAITKDDKFICHKDYKHIILLFERKRKLN